MDEWVFTLEFPNFISKEIHLCLSVNANVAKVGGLQSQDAKDEAVVNLLRTLGNAGS